MLHAERPPVWSLHQPAEDSPDLFPLSPEGFVVLVESPPESELCCGHSIDLSEGSLEMAGEPELEDADWPAFEFPATASTF
jgi:hypothetical protein